ncbi:MAG TPA: FkbM family methyltransferase [Lutibacter sp.]|nr:FkbM family methyltransferase [Arcobacter sp.]HIP47478.1 FkbM family methyltransferase [Lutibacter sp.]
MGIKTSLTKRFNWLTKVKFDKKTGFYKYSCFNSNIYVRYPRHFIKESETQWLCENLYYHYYLPKDNDVVVDLGAGYGEETVYLHSKSPNIKFFGVEIQPIIFECLSNTLNDLNKNFTCSSQAITTEESISLFSHFSYASVGEQPTEGYIDIATITWDDFLKKHNIESIDLFKMNIEGAEKDILSSITNFNIIKRFIISCHDFRANNGEGEFFRTKDYVLKILKENNYQIQTFKTGESWHKDWIYASREEL